MGFQFLQWLKQITPGGFLSSLHHVWAHVQQALGQLRAVLPLRLELLLQAHAAVLAHLARPEDPRRTEASGAVEQGTRLGIA